MQSLSFEVVHFVLAVSNITLDYFSVNFGQAHFIGMCQHTKVLHGRV